MNPKQLISQLIRSLIAYRFKSSTRCGAYRNCKTELRVGIVHRHELTNILRIEKPEDSVLLIFYGVVVKVKRYALNLAVSNPLTMAVA